MRRSRLYWLFFVCVSVPIVLAVTILVWGSPWFPAGDMAQAELHMRGFFSTPPLVGAAGRIVSDSGIQGSHPGPSLWFAMLPVYLIGLGTSEALLAAAASVHIASLALILLFAFRRGGRTLMSVVFAAFIAVIRSSGTDFMVEPWNPWLALLPFGVFVFLVMEVIVPIATSPDTACKKRIDGTWQMLAAVVVGSHCVQSHAGYALLVVLPLAVSLLVLTRRYFSDSQNSHVDRHLFGWFPVLSSLVVGLIVWSPAVLDQFRRDPGNLTILVQHFGSPREESLGISRSLDIVMTQMNVLGPWIGGPSAAGSGSTQVAGFVVFVLLIVVALGVARSRGWHTDQRAIFVLVMFLSLGAVSISRIFGPYFEYTVRWFWVLTALSVSTCLSIVTRFILDKIRGTTSSRLVAPRSITGVVMLLSVCLSVLTMIQVVNRVKLPGATESRILAGLIDPTVEELDASKTYQVRFYDPYTLNATGFGLTLALEKRGFTVKVDPEFAAAALPHRTARMDETDEILWVVVGPTIESARQDAALREIAYFDPRSPEQIGQSQLLLESVREGLIQSGREDLLASLVSPGASILFAEPPLPESVASLVRDLIRLGQPTAVFSMPVGETAISLQ